jgi:hypothetical protein
MINSNPRSTRFKSLRTKAFKRMKPKANTTQNSAKQIASSSLERYVQGEIEKQMMKIFTPNTGNNRRDDRGGNPYVSPQTRNGGFDARSMESVIDQMIAASLVRGKETSSVLRTLFGIVPTLIGR